MVFIASDINALCLQGTGEDEFLSVMQPIDDDESYDSPYMWSSSSSSFASTSYIN